MLDKLCLHACVTTIITLLPSPRLQLLPDGYQSRRVVATTAFTTLRFNQKEAGRCEYLS